MSNPFERCEGDDYELQQLRAVGAAFVGRLLQGGASAEEVAKIRVSLQPMFDCPVIVKPSTIRAGLDSVSGLAYTRYLIEHYSERQAPAWKKIRAELTQLQNARLVSMGRTVSQTNKARAQRARGGDALNGIIATLQRENPGESAKELWVRLEGALESAQMEPEEKEPPLRMDYMTEEGNAKKITFRTFQNKLSKSKKSF